MSTAKKHAASSESTNSKSIDTLDSNNFQVEQFLLSCDAFDSMIKNSEEFVQSLGVPCELVAHCLGRVERCSSKKNRFWKLRSRTKRSIRSFDSCFELYGLAPEIRCGPKKREEEVCSSSLLAASRLFTASRKTIRLRTCVPF